MLAGETYLLSPLTLGMIGAIENWIILQRTMPHDSIRGMLLASPSEDLQKKLTDRANKELRADYLLRVATSWQFQEFLGSEQGIVMSSWMCLRGNHPDVFPTMTATKELLLKCTTEERLNLARARDLASGLGYLCEADWESEDGMVRPHILAKRKAERAKYYQPMPWRKNIRTLIAEGSIAPEAIRDMTLYQFRILTVEEKELDADGLRIPLKGMVQHG